MLLGKSACLSESAWAGVAEFRAKTNLQRQCPQIVATRIIKSGVLTAPQSSSWTRTTAPAAPVVFVGLPGMSTEVASTLETSPKSFHSSYNALVELKEILIARPQHIARGRTVHHHTIKYNLYRVVRVLSYGEKYHISKRS